MKFGRTLTLGLLLVGCSSESQTPLDGGTGGTPTETGGAVGSTGGFGGQSGGSPSEAGGASSGGTETGGSGAGTSIGGDPSASGGSGGANSGGTEAGGSGGTEPASGGGATTGGQGGTGGNATMPTLLVISKTEGFRHDSIPAAQAAVTSLASSEGWSVTLTEDATLFNAGSLAAVDAVVFLSTTGDIFDADQQTAFQQFVESGGGVIGVHSATNTEDDWPYFQDLLGAGFVDHPEVQQANILIEDASHPATESLPSIWERTDEWYNFDRNPRTDVQVLLTVDEASYQGGTMGQDHPIAWVRQEPSGARVFYTALGHTSESYSDAEFLSHLAGGINWVVSTGP